MTATPPPPNYYFILSVHKVLKQTCVFILVRHAVCHEGFQCKSALQLVRQKAKYKKFTEAVCK